MLQERIELSSNPYHGFVLPFNYRSIGTHARSRTERTLPFERSDFARFVHVGICLVQPTGIEPVSTVAYLVGGLGIEPSSTALQAVAEITRLAHPPKT